MVVKETGPDIRSDAKLLTKHLKALSFFAQTAEMILKLSSCLQCEVGSHTEEEADSFYG